MVGCNIASVDVEDYYQVEAFSDLVSRSQWDTYPSRVEANTRRVLNLFDEAGIQGTYFILGWVAERHPQLIREIAGRGHELACHSYWHRLIYSLTPDEFREDTRRAKNAIEQAAGQPVYGYRAPSFSVTPQSRWALDILAELGFRYDSSIFPVKHDVYGFSGAPRMPFLVATPSGSITEYPLTTFRCGGRMNLPVAGGGYLRLLPYWYTKWGVERAWSEGIPAVSYIHPWEFDPEQPRLPGRLKSRLRHYTNLAKTERRLKRLFRLGAFSSFRDAGLAESAQPHELKGTV